MHLHCQQLSRLLIESLHLQLALNYTATSVTVTTNSTTAYLNSNASGTVYADQQLARVIGKHVI